MNGSPVFLHAIYHYRRMSSRTMTNRKKIVIPAVLCVVIYVASYVMLSRRGYAEMEQNNFAGFYYIPAADTDMSRLENRVCACLFSPLNLIDQMLGCGRPPASEPLWNLS